MKKSAFVTLVILLTLSVQKGFTQKTVKDQSVKSERVALKKLKGTTVGTIASGNFSKDFPYAKNVTSKRNDVYDEFHFTGKNGEFITAFYDEQGTLVGTSQLKAFSDLPAKGQQEIKTRYKDYTVGDVIFYDDNEASDTDMTMYGIQFDDVDSYFVELGKGGKKIIVQVLMDGQVMYFTTIG
jgi:hypothetical protein